ncbi:MAG: hypothetical protein WAV25_00250 [Minisyncoccia bacterium]
MNKRISSLIIIFLSLVISGSIYFSSVKVVSAVIYACDICTDTYGNCSAGYTGYTVTTDCETRVDGRICSPTYSTASYCTPVTCTTDNSCSATTPACGTTTYGTDNCGTTCSRTGAACACVSDGSCSASTPACNQTTYGVDNCGDSCIKTGAACPTPINGACSTTHYGCVAGTSANNLSRPSDWSWQCQGSNGGTNAGCTESKAAMYYGTPYVDSAQNIDGSANSYSNPQSTAVNNSGPNINYHWVYNNYTAVAAVYGYVNSANIGSLGTTNYYHFLTPAISCPVGSVCSGTAKISVDFLDPNTGYDYLVQSNTYTYYYYTPAPVVNCVGSWVNNSTCSASCGGGVLQQTYTITTPASGGGTACPYANGATQWGTTSCNTVCCAPLTQNVTVACDANAYSCAATSGNVTRSQTKAAYPTCTFPTPVSNTNSTYVSDTCAYPAPVDGGWSAYSPSASCPTSCGYAGGTLTRTCTNPAPSCGGAACVGSASLSCAATAACTCSAPLTQNVTVACDVNAYGQSATSGVVTRSQTKSAYPSCAFPAPPVTTANSTYVSDNCVYPPVVNGGWSAWSAWGTCSVSACGQTGTQTQTRTCTNPVPSGGGADCVGSATQSQSCSTAACPVNCVGNWVDNATCSVSCGGGVKQQTYTVTTPASGGGTACPYANGATQWGTTSCNATCCAPLTQNVTVACDVNAWGSSATSGSVTRSQTKSAYPSCAFPTPVSTSNSTYVSDNCVYPPAPTPVVNVLANNNHNPIYLSYGQTLTLSWSGTRNGACQSYKDSVSMGAVSASGSTSIVPASTWYPAQGGSSTYYVKCYVVNADSSIDYGTLIFDSVTVNGPPALIAPTGFVASQSSCDKNWLNLSWNASANATSYQVYRGGTLIYNGSGLAFSDTGLTLGSTYTYTIYASNAGGSSSGALTSGTVPNTCSYNLVITTTGTGSGTAGPSGSYNSGTVVALTNSPSTGSSFGGWSGDADCTDGSVTMSANRSCIATFTINNYTVTPSAGTGGSISPSTPQNVTYGNTTSFTVTPNSGYHINTVSGCGGTFTTSPYSTGVITGNCSVSATFAVDTTYSLSNSGNFSITKGATPVSGSNSVTRTSIGGAQVPVTLAVTGLPSGITVSSITSNPCPPSVGGCVSTINYSVAPSTIAGPYTLTVTGTGTGVPTVQTTFVLTVVSQSTINISSNIASSWCIQPSNASSICGSGTSGSYLVNPNGMASYLVTGYSVANYDGPTYYNDVTKTSTGSFSLFGGDSANVTLSYSPSFNYSLSKADPAPVTKGGVDVYTQGTVSVNLISGTAQQVDLIASGAPAGVSVVPSPVSCTEYTSGVCQSIVTFTIPPGTAAGTYPITFTGSPLSKVTSMNLVVNNPTNITATCVASPATAEVGDPVTWTATNISGGNGNYVSYVWRGVGIPTNPAPSTNPFTVTYTTADNIRVATVTITDSIGNHGECSASGSALIKIKPNFKEQ